MVELFFLTKRSIEKAMYYWGNFSDKEIFELMLQLVELELRGCFRLHIVWVVGRMQIAAGKDDFSRGCLTDGIALSGSILDLVTFKKTAYERYVSLLPWV